MDCKPVRYENVTPFTVHVIYMTVSQPMSVLLLHETRFPLFFTQCQDGAYCPFRRCCHQLGSICPICRRHLLQTASVYQNKLQKLCSLINKELQEILINYSSDDDKNTCDTIIYIKMIKKMLISPIHQEIAMITVYDYEEVFGFLYYCYFINYFELSRPKNWFEQLYLEKRLEY